MTKRKNTKMNVLAYRFAFRTRKIVYKSNHKWQYITVGIIVHTNECIINSINDRRYLACVSRTPLVLTRRKMLPVLCLQSTTDTHALRTNQSMLIQTQSILYLALVKFNDLIMENIRTFTRNKCNRFTFNHHRFIPHITL